MSNQEPTRKRRENRPTDSFGGPAKRGNTVSIVVVLVAFAFFLVVQWTKGDLGDLLQGTSTLPTASLPTGAAPAETSEPTSTTAAEDDASVARATATLPATQASTTTSQAVATQTPRATMQPTPTANAPPIERASDLPTVAYQDLPPEAQESIVLIDQGGPFPYSRDGVTFENRERLLPRQAVGYYREYTVITPGASDRGVRRIITGEEGEMYYTEDHYESFREIIR